LETQNPLVKLINSVDPKITINEHLGVLSTGIPTKWFISTEV